MKYAIIETGGKQYRVTENDVITVEKLGIEAGGEVTFDKVLVMGEGADVQIGTPYLNSVTVTGKVVENGKGKKVIIFKYKAKKDYRKKQGHRQPYTAVEITSIGSVKAKAPAAKAPAAKAPAAKEEAPVSAGPSGAPALKSMKKDELIAFAAEKGIEIDAKATKAVIMEAIESNLK